MQIYSVLCVSLSVLCLGCNHEMHISPLCEELKDSDSVRRGNYMPTLFLTASSFHQLHAAIGRQKNTRADASDRDVPHPGSRLFVHG